LRSTQVEGAGILHVPENYKPAATELKYLAMLNAVLPEDIRVLAWAPVPRHFNARYSCLFRTYRYFFIKEDLDIDLMREATKQFIGEHDFRNFCKLDVQANVNYMRNILSIDISVVNSTICNDQRFQVYQLIVCGYAFLWHQIRCMAAILFLIGKKLEQPKIISDLLDINRFPGKPSYQIADEDPLVLYECGYEDIEWNYDLGISQILENKFIDAWKTRTLRATVALAFKVGLEEEYIPSNDSEEYVTIKQAKLLYKESQKDKQKQPKYIPFSQRKLESSIEEKQKRQENKQKQNKK